MIRNPDVFTPALAALSLVVLALLPGQTEGADEETVLTRLSLAALNQPAGTESVYWRDERMGLAAAVRADYPFLDGQGRYCRSYSVTLVSEADGTHPESRRHIACQTGEGTWAGDDPAIAQAGREKVADKTVQLAGLR